MVARTQPVSVRGPLRGSPSRATGGTILYVNNFASAIPTVWNDGLGSASRDCDIRLDGRPTLRLDPQGQSNAGATSPGRTAATSGVVVKTRIHDGYRSRVGMEAWFRYTSLNNTSNAFLSASIYNRNGTQAHHGRIWLDPAGNNQPLQAKVLDGAATNALSGTTGGGTPVYTTVATSVLQYAAGSHLYEPKSGRLDRVGGWHWLKLVVDFASLRYVSLQLDGEAIVDLSSYQLDITDSAGFAGMHHSWEYCASTSTRPRLVNIGNWIGTLESR